MYLSRWLCILGNNAIIEPLSSILSSLELIRWPYGCARINREWRKGVIANWPDHFPSGATRGSFCLPRETIAESSAHPAKRIRMVMQDMRQVRPVLIAIEPPGDFETSQFGRFCDIGGKRITNERHSKARIFMNYLTYLSIFANSGIC